MASNGFSFFYKKLGLSFDNLAFHFDFENSGGSIENISGNSLISGVYGGGFSFLNGSGVFNNGFVSADNFEEVSPNNWSSIFVINSTGTNPSVIFSSLDSAISSGVELCVNSVNQLVFSSVIDGEVVSDVADLSLSNKNIVGITKIGNDVSVMRYSPESFGVKSKTITFPPGTRLNNFESFNIGSGKLSSFSALNGGVDEIAFIQNSINIDQFRVLSSGFLRGPYTYSGLNKPNLSFGADCIDGNYFITEQTITTQTEIPSDIDFDYLSTFQKNGLKFVGCEAFEHFTTISFGKIVPHDVTAAVTFDPISSYFRTTKNFSFGDLVTFKNGRVLEKTSQYLYTNQRIVTPSTSIDSVIVDSVPNEFSLDSFSSGIMISGFEPMPHEENSIYFANGELMISGLDYGINGGNVRLLNNHFENQSGNIMQIKFLEAPVQSQNIQSNLSEFNFYDDHFMAFVDRKRVPVTKLMQLPSSSPSFSNLGMSCLEVSGIFNNEETYFNE